MTTAPETGMRSAVVAALLGLACAGGSDLDSDEGPLDQGDETPPEPPPPATITQGELLCESVVTAPDTICYTCSAPDGTLVTQDCASFGEPVPEGSYCTVGLGAMGELCVWCCDLYGVILYESCLYPVEVICAEYHNDGEWSCTECKTPDGWIVSDDCVSISSDPPPCWSSLDCPDGQACYGATDDEPGFCAERPVE